MRLQRDCKWQFTCSVPWVIHNCRSYIVSVVIDRSSHPPLLLQRLIFIFRKLKELRNFISARDLEKRFKPCAISRIECNIHFENQNDQEVNVPNPIFKIAKFISQLTANAGTMELIMKSKIEIDYHFLWVFQGRIGNNCNEQFCFIPRKMRARSFFWTWWCVITLPVYWLKNTERRHAGW